MAVFATAGVVVVTVLTVTLARLKPADPTVDGGTVWRGTVERGPMIRQVRGTGTLVPVEIRVIPAATDGQVERVVVQPGTDVGSDSVILELSNPELQLATQDAEFKLKAGSAELERQTVQLKSELLAQESEVAKVEADYKQAVLHANADEELNAKGLIAPMTQKLSRLTADELANRYRIAKERMQFARQSMEAQLASQRAEIDQLRATLELRRSQVAGLQVRAGIAGVLQQVSVEVGQRVLSGAPLARVAEPTHLKAELKVPETQAKDVAVGQAASIDTRNGLVAGTVSRIDPAAVQGTVTLDVAFTQPLPAGARPDLTVDGTIEIEHLDDVLFVNRPVNAQPQTTVGLFRIIDDGAAATRVPVKLGRSSVSTIEIVDGLAPGDKVILSDMSAWDGYDRVRLK
ncbi:MAG TPA: HlyD family efflux transporter periplasmic adaptor subunit [Blastocatellia bacterium]|nr:HlyD family efflux transporter periplasmic adaptor subunit [Blastocatellia bacterium]